jgi:hypothetical protein
MDETQSRRVEALLDLYKQQMGQFRHTQQIEWKANFGVWTLLAGAIYIVTREEVSVHIPLYFAAGALVIVLVVHVWWLKNIHDSEARDKELWTRYRAEALPLIRGNDTPYEDETPWKRREQRIIWLLLEVTVTFLLCAFLLAILPR